MYLTAASEGIPSEADPRERERERETEGEGLRAVNELNARRGFSELRRRGKDVVMDDGRSLPMISLFHSSTLPMCSVLSDHSEAFVRVREPGHARII